MTFAKDDYVSDGRMTIIDKNASGSVIMVDDAYPTPHTINKTTVFGKSDQITTKGKNLINGLESFYKASESPSDLRNYCWGYSLGRNPLKLTKPLKPGTYTFSLYTDSFTGIYFSQSPYSGTNEMFSVNKRLPNDIRNGLIRYYGTVELKNESDIIGIYSEYSACCCGMLNEGTQPLPYEPYTGGKLSPSQQYPQEITNLNKAELVIAGRNLVEQSTTSTSAVNRFSSCLFVEADLMPSTNYVLSFNDVVGNGYYINEALFSNFHAFTTKSGRNVVKLSTKAEISKANTGQYVKQGWIILKNDKNQDKAPAFTDVQIELGDTATAYEPHQSKATPIDLKGNVLCSVTENREWSPNTFRDELVIDSEGNVSLIKRVFSAHIDGLEPMSLGATSTFQYFNYTPKTVRPIDGSIAIRSNRFGKIGREPWNFYVAGGSNAALFFTFPLETFANDGELNEWLKSNPIDVNYLGAEAQTTPLGKVEAPLLRNTVQTIYSNTNIPTTMNINYKSYLQEDTMAEKKYLDLAGLTGYDAKIKAAIDAKDATTLQGAKAYADSLGANYDAAGSATTAKTQAVQEAKGYTDGEITKVNAAVAEAKKTAEQGVTDAATATAAADKAQGEVDALETLVGTLPEDAGVATVVAYVDKKTEDVASDALLKQLQTTVGQHATDISGLKEKDTALQGAVDKAQGAATANKATIDQLVGTDKGKSVRAIANEELAAQLIPETADETLNTLKEIADWIQKHPNDAAAMNSAIEKLKTLIGTIPSEGVTAKDITGYIAEVKAALENSVAAEKSRAESAESGLGGRINTLEGKFGEGEDSVSSLIEAAKQAAIAAAAADAQNKANTAKDGAVADAKKYTDAEVGKVKTASDAIGARVDAAEGKITTLEGKAHTHANAEALNGITAGKVANWDAAFTAKHTHANASALDKVTDGKIAAWDGALNSAKAYTDQKIGEFVAISVSDIDALFADA